MFDQRIADAKHLITEAVSRLRHALKEADIDDPAKSGEIDKLEEQGKKTIDEMRRR